jgi:hypothetical protein
MDADLHQRRTNIVKELLVTGKGIWLCRCCSFSSRAASLRHSPLLLFLLLLCDVLCIVIRSSSSGVLHDGVFGLCLCVTRVLCVYVCVCVYVRVCVFVCFV